jgi:hypothetical protein
MAHAQYFDIGSVGKLHKIHVEMPVLADGAAVKFDDMTA